jgi:hypothetical protein
MNASSDPRRLVGALRFVAELSAVAAECARTGAWSDELTARRRLREDAAATTARRRTVRKAL